jgi:hypothetical protein
MSGATQPCDIELAVVGLRSTNFFSYFARSLLICEPVSGFLAVSDEAAKVLRS